MKKKLLIIAYYFPPIGGAGAQRPTKFAKYLSQDGWSVTVLTKEGIDRENRWEPEDHSFSGDFVAGRGEISIVRIPDEPHFKGQFAIDALKNWSIAAGKAAAKLMKEETYGAVLITMSPFSLIHAAEEIKKATNVPVFLDLRDPWILDGWTPQKSYLHWKINFNRMRRAFQNADGVIANTRESGALFLRNFPSLDADKFCVIENGFDVEDFSNEPIPRTLDGEKSETFTLVFSGSLCTQPSLDFFNPKAVLKYLLRYSPEKIETSGRTLIHLLKAVEILKARGEKLGEILRIECLGLSTDRDRKIVDSSAVGHIVTFFGYVPHDQAVVKVKQADALFLPLHGAKAGRRSRIVPGKTYEYLATGRPILGCLPEGDARELIQKCEVGVVADPLCPEDIADGLIAVWEKAQSMKKDRQVEPWIMEYERKALSLKLADFVQRRCS
ncbi:MAG: glycosyltransferase [Rhodobacteraceae bacterium]|nr:glycosyltransferase [Paracoccaceae bacterium]